MQYEEKLENRPPEMMEFGEPIRATMVCVWAVVPFCIVKFLDGAGHISAAFADGPLMKQHLHSPPVPYTYGEAQLGLLYIWKRKGKNSQGHNNRVLMGHTNPPRIPQLIALFTFLFW